MRTLDLTPLFRTSVGFDRMSRQMNSALRLSDDARRYPPYNIVKQGEDRYGITLAVAGFAEDELQIEVHEGRLTVTGKNEEEMSDVEYLHRGIAGRAFERTFQLADHIHVQGASVDRGLLHIDLLRVVPEAKRPRLIEIGSPAVEHAAAK